MFKLEKRLSNGSWMNISKIYTKYPQQELEKFLNQDYVIFSNDFDKKHLHKILQTIYSLPQWERKPKLPSIRLSTPKCVEIREKLGLTFEAKDSSCPRIFGGIWEDDGFTENPIRTVYQITCPSDDKCDEIIQTMKKYEGRIVYSREESVIRHTSLYSPDLFKELKKIEPKTRSLFIYRRELDLFPKDFLSELAQFYIKFLAKSLKNKSSAIFYYIPPEEYYSLLYMWILEILRLYNQKSGVPFGAYLLCIARFWVNSLSKELYDPKIHSINMDINKAKKIAQKTGQNPYDDKTLANILNISEKDFKKKKNTLDLAKSIKNPDYRLEQPIDSEEKCTIKDIIIYETQTEKHKNEKEIKISTNISKLLIQKLEKKEFVEVYTKFYKQPNPGRRRNTQLGKRTKSILQNILSDYKKGNK